MGTTRTIGGVSTTSDARSTLIMKPGDMAGAVAKARESRPQPPPSIPDDRRTTIMTPEHSALLAEANSTSKSHPVSQNVHPPTIALVQHELPPDLKDPRLVLLLKPDSEQASAFRVLRHRVAKAGNPQVIAVSGPTQNCGKTTVAINLATALAEYGRSDVLLIDANVRNPEVANLFRFVPPWCFAEQLVEHHRDPFSPWRIVNIASANLGLHVAAIDPRSTLPSRIDSSAFGIAIERLRLGNYQHIVIDCPSILGDANVNLIQDSTDGILLAARAKKVTTRDIRNAIDQLTPTRILGTALLQ